MPQLNSLEGGQKKKRLSEFVVLECCCLLFLNWITRIKTTFVAMYVFRWGCKVKSVGVRLGFIGIICLNLLFLPVSRGSVLFRSIDIPFEHATKYHVWLGHFVMALFTLHGLFLVIPWYFEGHLIARVCCITIHFLHGPLHGGFDC